ncbi:unnamed protein product [Alopecurus aequalis]
MDRSNAMAAAAASSGSRHEKGPSSVLLDFRGYSAGRKNASTASSKASTGHPIEVTFCIMSPPALSHFSVHCPGLQLPPDDVHLEPKAIATADDLVLLRVPVNTLGKSFFEHNDYFVYMAHDQDPKLDLLPHPGRLGDEDFAILGCGADGEKQYVVAALGPRSVFTFRLHLYRSKPGGETGSWTSQTVSVEEPLRDTVCPVPDTAERLVYHATTKVITLGGANGTVGWVDLWRGILLCDVLEESPKLRDLPLPWPVRGNWRRYLSDCESFCRDITVSQDRDSIKYVEMEIIPPRIVTTKIPGTPEPVTYLQWVQSCRRPPQTTRSLVPGQWRATTWSMPIAVTSWDDWRTECTARSLELHVDNPMHYELLQKLMRSGGDEGAKETTLPLRFLHMSYPTLSLDDDDVVYLLCKAANRGDMGLVIAIDVRKKELRGVAELDSQKNTSSRSCYLASGISKTYQDYW